MHEVGEVRDTKRLFILGVVPPLMSVEQKQYIIEASLSEPHINRDNGPTCGIMLYTVYLCSYL